MEQSQSRIQRLDSLTANQIAAGEVIERPVSVVKELVENAIDAGSDVISVEYREGGLALIRVSDDGAGIHSSDLPLAVERHATSKLTQIQDLDDLRTLGFRGEALASIASVASIEIVTRRAAEIEGYRLQCKGGEEGPVITKIGCPHGTQVTVEHLFYNTPARLKFMRSPGYEGGLIHDLMIRMALGHPRVGFRLENQGKLLFDTRGIQETEDLAELFYGKDARSALLFFEADVSKSHLRAWVTAPPYSRGTRKGLHFFINGRRIASKELQWATERAFEYVLPKGRFPLALLHFQMPGSLLDVNVHPGKLEVRINDPDLNPSVTRALRTAISGGQVMPDAGTFLVATAKPGFLGTAAHLGDEARSGAGAEAETVSDAAASGAESQSGKDSPATAPGYHPRAGQGRQGILDWGAGQPVQDWAPLYQIFRDGESRLEGLLQGSCGEPAPIGFDRASTPSLPGAADALKPPIMPETPESLEALKSRLALLKEKSGGSPAAQWGVQSHNKTMQEMAEEEQAGDFVFGPHTDFRIVGQLRGTFILAEVRAGILLVDQHVAHERILYEELLAKPARPEAAQMLLQPVSIHLTTIEEEALVRHILLFHDLGLTPERFGPRQYLIRSEPGGQSVDESMFKELLEKLGDTEETHDVGAAKNALLVMQSCKAAVKANTRLDPVEMHALLAGLQQTSHPMSCPHGRPIMYLLPYRRLISAFGRSSR